MSNEITPYNNYAGMGQDDLAGLPTNVPFLVLLQQQAPQCVEGDPKHVPGAAPGKFLLTASKQVMGSIAAVVAKVVHSFVEWRSRDEGGGFVASHDPASQVVRDAIAGSQAESGKRFIPWTIKLPNGNDLVDTYSVFLVLLDGDEPAGVAVLSVKKTAIPRLQEFSSMISSVRGAKDLPIFAHRVKISSTSERNKAGQPYRNIKFSPLMDSVRESMLPSDSPVLEVANQLRQHVEAGRGKADYAGDEDAAAESAAETKDVVF